MIDLVVNLIAAKTVKTVFFRFCLRTVFVFLTILLLILGYLTNESRRQRRILAALTNQGVTIEYFDQSKALLPSFLDVFLLQRVERVVGRGGRFQESEQSNKPTETQHAKEAVVDILALSELTSLRGLSLSDYEIEDISPLSKLTTLKTVYLENTLVRDISPLKNNRSLETLTIRDSPVQRIESIADFKELRTLEMDGTRIDHIAPLAKLEQLTFLSLSRTNIRDISPIENLKQLENLDLTWTKVDDLTALYHLKKLKSLVVREIPVSPEDIDAIASQLPQCKIHHSTFRL